MQTWLRQIKKLGACSDAIEWAEGYDTLEAAWAACEQGDWMLWLIGHTDKSAPWSEERKPLVRVSLECARLAWKWMPPAARQCVKLFEQWCAGGEIDRRRLLAAAANAYAYADAYAFAYADARRAYVAYAAYVAANAAYRAAYAAYAVAAYVAYAKSATLRECADIVRRHYPEAPATVAFRAEVN